MKESARPTGPEIRGMMARFGVQQTELAARMGTSRPNVTHWLTLRAIPQKQLGTLLLALAELLDERADAIAGEVHVMRNLASGCREDAREIRG